MRLAVQIILWAAVGVVSLCLLVIGVAGILYWLRPDPAAAVLRDGRDRPADDLAAILEGVRAKHKLPSLAGAVIRGGQSVSVAAVGARREGDPTPVSEDDLWHIGSCTKAMTATLLAVLVEEGLLRWDSTIGEVLADDVAGIDGAWKSVTIDQLLSHRGGVPSNLDAGGLWSRLWKAAETKSPVEQRRMLLEGVLTRPPAHAPGTKFLYANAGYTIAGAMAEKVTGQPWEDLMRSRLFDPLHMGSAGFGAPGTPESLDQPRGHTRSGAAMEPGLTADNPPAIGPGGTVHCSMQDWAKFVAMHLEGARNGLPGIPRAGVNPSSGPGVSPLPAIEPRYDLLTPESFAHLHKPSPPPPAGDYALGWSVTTRPWARGDFDGATGRVLTHNGSNTMWFAVVWIAPEKNLAVMAATNTGSENAAKACDEAVWQLIQAALGQK